PTHSLLYALFPLEWSLQWQRLYPVSALRASSGACTPLFPPRLCHPVLCSLFESNESNSTAVPHVACTRSSSRQVHGIFIIIVIQRLSFTQLPGRAASNEIETRLDFCSLGPTRLVDNQCSLSSWIHRVSARCLSPKRETSKVMDREVSDENLRSIAFLL
ncbi:hypothetical protein FB451DRAFT_1477221, partial [Mycena latifolia]